VNYSDEPGSFLREDFTLVSAEEVEEMYAQIMTAEECVEENKD
jgi:hypothetical protein